MKQVLGVLSPGLVPLLGFALFRKLLIQQHNIYEVESHTRTRSRNKRVGNLVSRASWMHFCWSYAGRTLDNIQEAIELYLEPDAVELLPGAVIREVTIG